MWVMVMFDLPVDTKKRAKAAAKFREFLLDEGFEMTQFSIYLRFCSGKEQFESYTRRIEGHLPEFGKVHVLAITDRQYENIRRFTGRTRSPAAKKSRSVRDVLTMDGVFFLNPAGLSPLNIREIGQHRV